ncbi:hypothetical protein B0H13DRAFT_2299483 [Mycena leptocephala]|nr:hypothetical protein B0H13DRAFT_2299483 [Mycena leptocephala]
MIEGPTSTTAPVHTAQDLALRLHCLGATAASARNVLNQRNDLEDHFGKSKDLANKFISVVQALSTLCTPSPGKDNVAVMVGLTNSQVHVFCAQNGGASSQATAAHMSMIWELVQKIHKAAQVPSAASDEKPIRKKLADLGYLFVKEKTLSTLDLDGDSGDRGSAPLGNLEGN